MDDLVGTKLAPHKGMNRKLPKIAAVALLALAGMGPAAAAEDLGPHEAIATFAGGCFWCMEPPFDAVEGVKRTLSGYTGGTTVDPTYEQVSAGNTGHRESVEVIYDPSVVSYDRLLDVFWHNIDPLDDGGQFCDRGMQYTTAIFYNDDKQRRLAEHPKKRSRRVASCMARSSRRSSQQVRSTQQRTITRTFMSVIRCVTSTIGLRADATRGSTRSGAPIASQATSPGRPPRRCEH